MRPLALSSLAALTLLAACHSGWPESPAPPQNGPPQGAYPQGGYPPPGAYPPGQYAPPGADPQNGYPPQQPPAPQPAAPQPQPALDPFSAILRGLGSGPPPPGWTIPSNIPAVPLGGLPWPFPGAPGAQPQPQPAPMPQAAPIGPSARSLELFRTINEYRVSRGLPAIPFSRALTQVAETHVADLDASPPPNGCNAHSWSTRGGWTACCYTPDHAQAQCMWRKPAELTRFPATGFEIAVTQYGGRLDARTALESWKSSPPHHAVILNQDTWAKSTWRAMGAGISDGHATAWFAEQPDPQP